ncbi:hypothetical protein FZEAL_90 [Fusarium zealandicum]|uniref:GH16 domain-containing protein n=1 Tax=Fusarium zealandicum TaxID=1053134 RepID=A0A8H4UVG7_9HYPO|nr:hypothetical protein FZEAL_90 [Fusarium zealandicum]
MSTSYHWILAAIACFIAVTAALQPPTYSGYTRVWEQTFTGKLGTLPSESTWDIIVRDKNYNNELQRYVKDNRNLRLSGQGTLQLIPQYTPSAPINWTSSRIESKYKFTPKAGKITRLEASIRLGGNSQLHKKGIWPAFWLLGDAHRRGVEWPKCGEIDIMENINGEKIGYGAVHCDKVPGGICNEPIGIASQAPIPNISYHVWRVQLDRRSSNFKSQSITWYMDDRIFHRVTGSKIADANAWKALCQSPLYIILNVAVGGDWPGAPTKNTWGDKGSWMEVGYIAHYVSK